MNLAITGNNLFHTGWLACYLGMPRLHPGSSTLAEADAEAFCEGWDTCNETSSGVRHATYEAMRRLGQVVISWVDSNNRPLGPSRGAKQSLAVRRLLDQRTLTEIDVEAYLNVERESMRKEMALELARLLPAGKPCVIQANWLQGQDSFSHLRELRYRIDLDTNSPFPGDAP